MPPQGVQGFNGVPRLVKLIRKHCFVVGNSPRSVRGSGQDGSHLIFTIFLFLEDFLRALPGTNSSLCSRQNPKFLDFRFIHKVPKSRICAHGAFLHNNLKIRTILRNGTVCILYSTVYKITKSNAADNDEKKSCDRQNHEQLNHVRKIHEQQPKNYQKP